MDNLCPELVAYILDFLHASAPLLASSSLVCRNWLPATRYHLFSTPVLCQISSVRSPSDNTCSFIELLDSPLCTFRHSIQGCILNIQRVSILRTCIDALAAHTTLTGTLLITQHECVDIDLTRDLQLSEKFCFLRSFVYSNLSDVWSSDLSQLIISLPHLESLSIFTDIYICSEVDMAPGPHGGVVLPNLKVLRLRMFNPSKFLCWMLDLPGYKPQIEVLDMVVSAAQHIGWGLLEVMELFLVANTGTLKNLYLVLEYRSDFPHGLEVQRLYPIYPLRLS
ncbi:hypothetical protein BDP27DRAFT_1420622 [Rhodocollybia butyracea]|uniref:F-box domain-containing protein n=1 Tax=Rhodocollybia butyracea TaxID=206335 RepID=A0A9P5PX80_9AGAR|nr:hypothetical protein BDP27DRAFT_1420622 [Rhodocollybia butyracea]